MHSYWSYYRRGAIPNTPHGILDSPFGGFRAAYVREATRFKATLAAVNDPSRNAEVIQGAVDAAPAVHLPQIVAQVVYEGIINSSVLFEECIVSATPPQNYSSLTRNSLTLTETTALSLTISVATLVVNSRIIQ
jgi:hypothetical protein